MGIRAPGVNPLQGAAEGWAVRGEAEGVTVVRGVTRAEGESGVRGGGIT